MDPDPDPTCLRCSKPIRPGTTARYSRDGWTHVTCEARDRGIRHVEALDHLQRERRELGHQVTEARGQIREARERAGLPPDLMVVATDVLGCLVLFNSVCETVTGYLRTEVLGQPLIELLVPEAWRGAMAARLRDASDESFMQPFRCPWRIRSGEERMIEWRYGVRGLGTPNQLAFGIGTVVD